jgi:hypothetical protein
MADPIKRVHYFDHQFLHADDFIDEQEYHIRLRRLHNAALHTWGIARGLDLSFKTGESRATVSEGVAVDVDGREIVLANSSPTPDLSSHKNKTVYITIAYSEKGTDPTTETGVSGETRMTEEPEIRVAEDPPVDPSQELILGRLKLDENAKITLKDEGEERNKRRLAGVIGGDLEARSLRLSLPDAARSQWPALSCGAAKRIDLTGSLSISGNVGTGTAEPKNPLSVSGGAAIGSGYADKTAPDNGLLVEGNVGIGTSDPKMELQVIGDIGLGSKEASLYAPGGFENLNLIRGTVAPDGGILGGQGYSVDHTGPGLYNITFRPAFSAKPTVVVTQQFPNEDNFSSVGGAVTDNCVVVAVSNTCCRIKTGNSERAADRRFHFVAIGPR